MDKTIYLSESGEVCISDLSGRQLMRIQHTDVVKTNLPAGVYIVSYNADNTGHLVKKIVIK